MSKAYRAASELLKIHALVRMARGLVFVGAAAEEISLACRRRAGRILDEAMAGAARMSGMQKAP
jgi:hypothetical protein